MGEVGCFKTRHFAAIIKVTDNNDLGEVRVFLEFCHFVGAHWPPLKV